MPLFLIISSHVIDDFKKKDVLALEIYNRFIEENMQGRAFLARENMHDLEYIPFISSVNFLVLKICLNFIVYKKNFNIHGIK